MVVEMDFTTNNLYSGEQVMVAKAAKKTAKTVTPRTVAPSKFGARVKADLRKTLKNADRALTLTITQEHINRATCGDPAKCVIAQALAESALGMVARSIEVGATCTKVATDTEVIRFKTPYKLAVTLKAFDVTNNWNLPPGQYTLLPYTGAQRRWESAKRQGGKQDVFRGQKAAPTRYVQSIATMCKLA